MKNKSLRRDARAAQRKVPAELARSPAARTPDGVLDLTENPDGFSTFVISLKRTACVPSGQGYYRETRTHSAELSPNFV